MKSEDATPTPPAQPAMAVDPRLQALMVLKERLQELHAELEYTRMMLKMKRPLG